MATRWALLLKTRPTIAVLLGTDASRPAADENYCLAEVAGKKALARAVAGAAGVVAAAAAAAAADAAAMVAEGRQQGALVVATAVVVVTPILPVGLAAASPSLKEDLAVAVCCG